MEELQNFGPNDATNGTLARMFRNAGINDVRSHIDDIREETTDFPDETTSINENDVNYSESKRFNDIFDKPLRKADKPSNGKVAVNNVKQMYKLYKSMDKNGDGKITVEDVEIILKEMGLGFISKHLARALFEIVDTNHNGRLDFRDLLALTDILKRISSQMKQ